MSIGPKSLLLKAISDIQNDDTISLAREASGQVQNRTYKYLTIDKLHSEVFPKLKEHGLVWITMPAGLDDGQPALYYELGHVESGESISAAMPLCLAKLDPQGLGAAITYARRYALLSVLGLIGEDDTDGATPEAKKKSQGSEKGRSAVPAIPLDRAKRILEAAQSAGLAEGTKLQPALAAKLVDVGVQTGKLGHLNVDQAEDIEGFIAKEAE
jgi:hypothetical protein